MDAVTEDKHVFLKLDEGLVEFKVCFESDDFMIIKYEGHEVVVSKVTGLVISTHLRHYKMYHAEEQYMFEVKLRILIQSLRENSEILNLEGCTTASVEALEKVADDLGVKYDYGRFSDDC